MSEPTPQDEKPSDERAPKPTPDPALPVLASDPQRTIERYAFNPRDPRERELEKPLKARLINVGKRLEKHVPDSASFVVKEGFDLLKAGAARVGLAGWRYGEGQAEKDFEEKEAKRAERLRADDLHVAAMSKAKAEAAKAYAEAASAQIETVKKLVEAGISFRFDPETGEFFFDRLPGQLPDSQ